MNAEEYVDAIDGMDIETLRANFEALEELALSIEEEANGEREEVEA